MAETTIRVESWDGKVITISGRGKGDAGVWLSTDPAGFWAAPQASIWNQIAYGDGADFGGFKTDKRTITFSVHVLATRNASWERNWSEWVRMFRCDKDSYIWYETKNSVRKATVRLSKNADMTPEVDPEKVQYAAVKNELIAGDPWWYEPTETSEFVTATDTTSSGTESGFVTISNPTPLPMYPVWLFQGTAGITWVLPDYSFGQEDMFDRDDGSDATRTLSMPPTLEGEHVLIDVDPLTKNGQANSSLDTEYILRMNGVRFMYPVPPYTDRLQVPVSVSKAPIGAGVQLRMRRAWPTPMGLL